MLRNVSAHPDTADNVILTHPFNHHRRRHPSHLLSPTPICLPPSRLLLPVFALDTVPVSALITSPRLTS